MSKEKKPPSPFFKEKRDFIKRIVKAESIIWPREIKIANNLWSKYPDPLFWSDFVLTFQLNSLAWLVGEGGNELNRQWNFFQLDKRVKKDTIQYTEPLPIEEKKEFKPRTMKDWMNQSKT